MCTDFQIADNGKWYGHATVGELKKWYIYFDDDNPIELIIRKVRVTPTFKTGPYMTVDKLIRHFKLPIKIIKQNFDLSCRFPDKRGKWIGKMLQALSYNVELIGTIPANLIICYDEVFDTRPNIDGKYFDGAIRI